MYQEETVVEEEGQAGTLAEEGEENAEDFVDVMNPIEEHLFARTGQIPPRITRYYTAMRKVLQVQVNHATGQIHSPSSRSQVVPAGIRSGKHVPAAQSDNEDEARGNRHSCSLRRNNW